MRTRFAIRTLALGLVAALALAPAAFASEQDKDIVDTAVAAGSFKTLVKAVQAAGLVDTLKSPGPFTVFAPTDEAFAKLPAGTLEALLKDIPKLKEAKTVQGQSVKISTSGGVMVDGAKVVKTDIVTSNGVIHVIDSVILPR